METGKFIISLDFELHWGAAEKWDINAMKPYFDATRKSIPEVLRLFTKYDIHATWATVGFLFAKDKQQLKEFAPRNPPPYDNKQLKYYDLVDNGIVGNDEQDDPYHYATSLISDVIRTPNQEMSTHTFAHYYCNEPGQTPKHFEEDIKAAQAIAKANFNIELRSLVFPRNQFNTDCVAIAKQNGIIVVRSNPNVWFWQTSSRFHPIARAFDTLMPISGTVSFKTDNLMHDGIMHLPASRFLRPYAEKEKLIQGMKLNRIKSEMNYAAKNNRSYHLWWHPHNFGYHTAENLAMLEEILRHYKKLEAEFDFESRTMIEMYES